MVPSMIRNQNEGMKKKTHEGIKRRTVGEAAMATGKRKKKTERSETERKRKQSVKNRGR